MKRSEELQRKALLHRQAAFLLRREAARHDRAAKEIDGEVSETEKQEAMASLEILLLRAERATPECRLASLGV